MYAPANHRILYLVVVVLMTYCNLLTCVHSQGAGDVWFSFNGTTYQNNSIVALEDIGEWDHALFCITTLHTCCRYPYSGSLGNWFFPNGSRVFSYFGDQWDFYRVRGQMVIYLNRRRGGVEGIYRCEIPDSLNFIQTIYIGMYTTVTGSPSITSLTFDDQSRTLTCTSTGGPATTVTWRRDGVFITLNATHQQTKRLVDSVNGTYQTVLTIDPSVGWRGIVGTYSCTVKNDRGESSETVVVPGAGDVWFSLNGTTYQNNSCVALEDIGERDDALLCMTNLTACCRQSEKKFVLGNWFFPNGTRVPSRGNQLSFYRDRGQMVVALNRIRGRVEGIYRCEIPDSMSVTQTIYIGVYTGDTASIHEGRTSAQTVGATTTTVPVTRSIQPTKSDSAITTTAGTVPVSSSIQPTKSDSAITTTAGTVPVTRSIQPTKSDSAITTTAGTVPVSISIQPTKSDSAITTTAGTVPVSSSIQPTKSDSAITTTAGTVPVSSSIQPTKSDSAITTTAGTVLVSSSIQPTKSDSAITTTAGTVLVSSSSTQPTNNPPSDGSTTTSVIIVVAVVIILVVIVVGVVILVVLFRTKKRKQQLEINKLQTNTIQNADIEVKLKQEETTKKEASSSVDHPPYKVSNLLYQSMDQQHDPPSTTSVPQGNNFYAVPNTTSSHTNEADIVNQPLYEVSNLLYQSMDQHHDPPSTTNVPKGNDIYTEPDTTSSHTVETQGGIHEAVYSEPVQPSLFMDAVGSPSHCEHLQPYAPIYTIPTALLKSEVLLKVSGSNIREIHELGMGIFGKVILAETVGLSAKDLRLSESDDDKSKSMLVAVKKLKSDAPNATKEAFEKEVNFMSRLTDRNVIRILGVCNEDTPFIMMEYMEKGDLNQYLRKFKTLNTINSEPQGQITTSTLVHMTTQIASAMKYLALHNFIHRDLATRNCLVGPNYLVKISNLGMSRDLYESHYYRIRGHASLPVRWMSIECFYGKFSQKSDVWAFGVTMWEIFTLAKKQPYSDMSDKQIIEDAIKGKNRKLLAKPKMCPLEVYETMLKCWTHNPKQRTTFDELFHLLTSIHSNQ